MTENKTKQMLSNWYPRWRRL